MVRDLNLSEDQQKQIKSAVREYRTKLIDLRANAEKAEAEMEEAFNDEIFDQRRANVQWSGWSLRGVNSRGNSRSWGSAAGDAHAGSMERIAEAA